MTENVAEMYNHFINFRKEFMVKSQNISRQLELFGTGVCE